jgi:prefoldin subunit 2
MSAFINIINKITTEIQARFSRFQNDLQQLAQKIGELESEAEEHE